MDYSKRKVAKWRIYLLWDKVLTDVHEKVYQKCGRKSSSPKSPWTIAHEHQQNGGFTCSGDRLTLKMGRFSHEGQLAL
ncbi:hypothetical protein H5410_058793 [Solanum commersonii]|uniref:Uncharacterized protein n=1 Tax=Solanum commersonii TaxID=4109 RepID=A0A9J5WRV7_SOLCO|nr:hypothetical protein H5410_058793 [Solanum commersonii]